MTNAYAARLTTVRAAMRAHQPPLDILLVPMNDPNANEYVEDAYNYLKYLVGFTGSAGHVMVTAAQTYFFTDSRYTVQAKQQLAGVAEIFDTADTSVTEWLKVNLKPGQTIGYDPWLHSIKSVETMEALAATAGAQLVATPHNIISASWADRPKPNATAVVEHPLDKAGETSADKRTRLANELKKEKLDAAVLTDPTSIAWLLNIRAQDSAMIPIANSFAFLHADGQVDWFIDDRRLARLKSIPQGVAIMPPDSFVDELKRLGSIAELERRAGPARIGLKHQQVAAAIGAWVRAGGATLVDSDDPCERPKARKNKTEIEGAKRAHERDAVAVITFLSQLDEQIANGRLPTELDIEKQLRACRQQQPLYQTDSFDTIAGAGAHGAIVHYRATEQSNARLKPGELFLLDSGGQYLDGTTDITRTIAVGVPDEEMRDRYTRVLKAHIALSVFKFPAKTPGSVLDGKVRAPLWDAGLDYGHGTGHGVGSYLSVHEGPQSISKRGQAVLEQGMIVSNEPGYYKEGHYGIRIENLLLVKDAVVPPGGELAMHSFDTLTLVPYDLALINAALLSQEEVAWVNSYHQRVYETIAPLLKEEPAKHWLKRATRPIDKPDVSPQKPATSTTLALI